MPTADNLGETLMSSSDDPKRRRLGLFGFDAYQVALEFYRQVCRALRGKRGHVADQLRRASESIVLNVAEAYPTSGADRARRFQIADNEASESAAALDLLEARGDLAPEVLERLRDLLDRECAMLWRLSR